MWQISGTKPRLRLSVEPFLQWVDSLCDRSFQPLVFFTAFPPECLPSSHLRVPRGLLNTALGVPVGKHTVERKGNSSLMWSEDNNNNNAWKVHVARRRSGWGSSSNRVQWFRRPTGVSSVPGNNPEVIWWRSFRNTLWCCRCIGKYIKCVWLSACVCTCGCLKRWFSVVCVCVCVTCAVHVVLLSVCEKTRDYNIYTLIILCVYVCVCVCVCVCVSRGHESQTEIRFLTEQQV